MFDNEDFEGVDGRSVNASDKWKNVEGCEDKVVRNQHKSRSNSRSFQDSDSDFEDFLHVLKESQKAFEFIRVAILKFHKDHLDGVAVHDPTEFVSSYCLVHYVRLFGQLRSCE